MATGVGSTEAGSDRHEVEWQLATTDLGAVHRWLAEHHTIQGLVVEHRPPLQVHDTYFDTIDWRIQRAGFALRVRNTEGESEATLKGLSASKEGLANRRELTESLTDADPDAIGRSAGPVGTRVLAVAGTHALQALFSVNTTRQRFAVRKQDEADELGEIALDETVISRADGEPQTSIQRVEVEALTGEFRSLEGLVKALSADCTLESAADSKYAVGLRTVGLMPPSAAQLAPDHIDGSMRVDELAVATLRAQLSAWVTHEPGARLGEDPEELHDLRLAARRIDATLTLFAQYLPAALVRMRARLKMILQALGNVRDLDVQLANIDAFERNLAAADRAAIQPLRSRLDAERTQARTRMLRILDSPQTEKWLARLKVEALKPSISRAHRDHEPIICAVPLLLRSRHKKLCKAAARLSATSSMEEYHAVRGRIKKLRYAVESVEAIYGKPADAFLRSLQRLQDPLGEQQDAHVTLTRLQELARQPPKGLPTEAVFLMGRMAESHVAAAAHGRSDFEKSYPKLRKRWKRLRHKLDQLRERAIPSNPMTPDNSNHTAAGNGTGDTSTEPKVS